MKVIATIFLSIFFCSVEGQNLVPNPSFEDFYSCPNFDSQLNRAVGWVLNINTADYYNACSSLPFVSVPANSFGFQDAFNGNAYAGFFGKARNLSEQEAREFLGAKLLSPLIVGTRYYVSFYVSLNAATCFTNKIGMLFANNADTTSPYAVILPTQLNNFAHVYSNSLITDTMNWIKISGYFIADSAYKYFLIGNFFDDAHIDSVLIDGSSCSTYYYVDEVCVSTDSLTCDVSTEIKNYQNEQTVNIYPNPSSTATWQLTVGSNLLGGVAEVFDAGGRIVFESEIRNTQSEIAPSVSRGVYLLRISSANGTVVRKLVRL